MNFRKLLASKGIHYLVTRFGWSKLRSLAFDGKYQRGDWNFQGDSTGELPEIVLRYSRKGDLLVMGCGGAAVLEGMEAKGLNSALGIDLSPEAVRLAGRFASKRICFEISDMESFECPHPCDVILFSESLYYVPSGNQVPLLQRLALSLKPGGVFVVTFAEANRYQDILKRIRSTFEILEDRTFAGSSRYLIVFSQHH